MSICLSVCPFVCLLCLAGALPIVSDTLIIIIVIIIIIYVRWQHDTKMAINNHDVVALSTLNVVPCTLPVMMLVIHRSIGDER